MLTNLAPVALFIYQRPDHVRRTIASLQACDGFDGSPIYVFADGPKSVADRENVIAARAIARDLLGSRAVYAEQDNNRGLANSVIAGTTELCEQFGRVIVVEDDLVLSPGFLRFLNDGLVRYRNEARVMQISGHMFDVPSLAGEREAMLLPMTTSWGWGTWKRSWDMFDPMVAGWRERLADASIARRFNLDGAYDYGSMLRRQQKGAIDSWAVRWYYSVFVNDGLSLFPPRTLVFNGGLDGSGTHDRLALPARQATLDVAASFSWPDLISESRHKEQVFEAVRQFRTSSRLRRVVGGLKAGVRLLRGAPR